MSIIITSFDMSCLSDTNLVKFLLFENKLLGYQFAYPEQEQLFLSNLTHLFAFQQEVLVTYLTFYHPHCCTEL